MTISDKEMTRLLESDFFLSLRDILSGIEFYTRCKDAKSNQEMFQKLNIARLALQHITGINYIFYKTSDGECGLRDCQNPNNILIKCIIQRKYGAKS